MFKIGDKIIVQYVNDDFETSAKPKDIGTVEDIKIDRIGIDEKMYFINFGDNKTGSWMFEYEIRLLSLKVYIAAPFFSQNQIRKVELVEEALQNNSTILSYFSPRSVQIMDGLVQFTPKWANAIAMNDYREVREADIVVAIVDFDNNDTDSGTAAEIGYAYALGKKVYLVNFEQQDDMTNLMLTEASNAYFKNEDEIENYDFLKAEHIPYDGEYI